MTPRDIYNGDDELERTKKKKTPLELAFDS